MYQESILSRFMRNTPVSAYLLIINVMVYILVEVFTFSTGNEYLIYDFTIHNYFINLSGEYYRLLTSGFIHFGIAHLLLNMYIGIYVFGSQLERLVGSVKFAILYLGSLVCGAVIVYGFNELMFSLTSNTDYILTSTAGASGAIYGLLGAFLYLAINRPDFMSPAAKQSIYRIIFINVAFSFIVPGISIIGHFGGLTVGYIISMFLLKRKERKIDGFYNYDDIIT